MKPAVFKGKAQKNPAEARYWKKFVTVYGQLEPGYTTNDAVFAGKLLATATATRVDVWKLEAPTEEDADEIKPRHTLRNFHDIVTAVDMRADGVVIAGDKLGKIQLVHSTKKLTLRSFDDFKTQINCLKFSPCGRFVAACANETTWRLYDI